MRGLGGGGFDVFVVVYFTLVVLLGMYIAYKGVYEYEYEYEYEYQWMDIIP